MSENSFTKIIAGVVATLITLILVVYIHNAKQIDAITEMTKNGVDPILAGCAVGTIDRHNNICSFYIGKNSQTQDKQ